MAKQADFRSGKSTTGQLLNLTQHIEDGFCKKKITGAAFVDLSTAYNTVNYSSLLKKVRDTTNEQQFTLPNFFKKCSGTDASLCCLTK